MPSAKEREILERQRQLAARMQKASEEPVAAPVIATKRPRPTMKPAVTNNTNAAPLNRGSSAAFSLSKRVNTVESSNESNNTNAAGSGQNGNSNQSGEGVRSLGLKTKTTVKNTDKTANANNDTTVQASKPAAAAPIKRPTKKTAHSQQAFIAAAKAKLASKEHVPQDASYTNDTNLAGISATGTTKNLTQSIARKTEGDTSSKNSSAAISNNSLASILQSVSSTGATMDPDDMHGSAGSTTAQPDDYWKYLREWDFVSYYSDTLRLQQQQSSSKSSSNKDNGNDDNGTNVSTKKALPNVFYNARHYIAAWAPLCLAECKAQLLQELMTNGPNTLKTMQVKVEIFTRVAPTKHNRGRRFDDVSTLWNDDVETGMHVQLLTKQRGSANTGLQFMTHDLVLLLRSDYKDVLYQLQRGNAKPPGSKNIDDPHAFSSVGMIGHCETSFKEVDRMIVKVSKKKWAQVGDSTMHILKIGNNITALREYTALCRMDSIPMQKYLLGTHLEKAENRRKLSRNQTPEQLLEQMGGTQALGKGFLEYTRGKFNNSQLTAIAASAHEYGDGGFTLIKGPPGTGKTTTLTAVLNSLHIRQYNKYYEEVRRIATQTSGTRQHALELARKAKPRLLVCAPSNAAVDNIILKIMEDGFVDGSGKRYNPSMIRVGVGQSAAVKPVALETKVDAILGEGLDLAKLETSQAQCKDELSRITNDITNMRKSAHAIATACPYALSRDWEIRINEDSADENERVYYVNHKTQTTTYDMPPPPGPDEMNYAATSMPNYRKLVSGLVKLVERYFSVKQSLERATIIKGGFAKGASHFDLRCNLESHVLNSVHMVMTTLGSAGNRAMENADKFEVVVVDEAAQSVEPASLSALQLGSRHVILVGDPQQLPATIFNVSGRGSKYDRSLFQRLEEAGQPVYMLNEQYRMHPNISHFPRHIFYGGALLDGPNVTLPDYGNPLRQTLMQRAPNLQPFTVLDLDSQEERGGTSLSNSSEAQFAVFLYMRLKEASRGLSAQSKVAVITPYAQQARLLKQIFSDALGPSFENLVEVNTVDAFQGREASIVIFSAVRAAGSHGIGFLADVRRMNVALTRAKHYLFVIARCESVSVNPYWDDLVSHARSTKAVLRVPIYGGGRAQSFGDISEWRCDEVAVGKQSLTQQLDSMLKTNTPAISATKTAPRDPRIKKPVNSNNATATAGAKRGGTVAVDPRKRPKR